MSIVDAVAPAHEATLLHLGLLQRKLAQLEQVRVAAEEQFCSAVGRAHAAGELSDEQLESVYWDFRAVASMGFARRWDGAVKRSSNYFSCHGSPKLRYTANGPDGTWLGPWPLAPPDPRPPVGTSVVYVLFDDANHPCYVGSTYGLATRLRQHVQDGKPVTTWVARGCADREEAGTDVEEEWLASYQPYLNKRVTR